ncbi:MAG: family transporter protein [Marmoricola sp.]|nr:family transporter protein [Marmoricola sp.]
MISLTRVELARYASRRAILLLLALAAVLAAVMAFQSAWDSRPATATEIATAKAHAEVLAGRADVKTDLDRCLADPVSYLGPGATAEECRAALTAAPTSYLPRDPLNLRSTIKGNGIGLALIVIGLLVIAGSTFAGADWSSGSIRNQVIFEPRRSRLWGAKAIAVTLASGLAALVTIGGFWIAVYCVAVARDIPHDSAVVHAVGWHVLRAVVLAMAAGLGAFALTMVFRHSMATLSVLFAYSIGGEILINLLPLNSTGHWSLGANVFGWLQTKYTFVDPTAACTKLGDCAGPQHLGHGPAALYLAVALAVVTLASWATFRRRDI